MPRANHEPNGWAVLRERGYMYLYLYLGQYQYKKSPSSTLAGAVEDGLGACTAPEQKKKRGVPHGPAQCLWSAPQLGSDQCRDSVVHVGESNLKWSHRTTSSGPARCVDIEHTPDWIYPDGPRRHRGVVDDWTGKIAAKQRHPPRPERAPPARAAVCHITG
ncbi:hypothetical protein LTR74_005319 [Friedmanniomyces endolithicus]|nr:hypothetical protein LTR74_005319 [Friedmanniomyces endolithicus]